MCMIIPIALENKSKADRTCGKCTKCCDGWLSGVAYGHEFRPGVPCHFVTRQGCSIYPIRPDEPCKTFRCHWKENTQIPDWMQPNLSGVIVMIRYLEKHRYIRMSYAGRMPSEQVFAWAEEHAKTGANIVGFDAEQYRIFSNNPEFVALAKQEFSVA